MGNDIPLMFLDQAEEFQFKALRFGQQTGG